MTITGFIIDAQENCQNDNEIEILPKKIEPTLEQSSPLHSLQVFFYFSIFTNQFRHTQAHTSINLVVKCILNQLLITIIFQILKTILPQIEDHKENTENNNLR